MSEFFLNLGGVQFFYESFQPRVCFFYCNENGVTEILRKTIIRGFELSYHHYDTILENYFFGSLMMNIHECMK